MILWAVGVIASTDAFPWENIGKCGNIFTDALTDIQFPWRYLTIVTLTECVLTTVGLSLFDYRVGMNEKNNGCGVGTVSGNEDALRLKQITLCIWC